MRALKIILALIALVGASLWIRYDVICRILGRCGDDANQRMLEDIERSRDLTFTVDGDTVLEAGEFDQFAFRDFDANPILNKNNEEYLIKVLAYVNANPNTILTILGRYSDIETDSTSGIYEDFGIARGAKLRQWFTQKRIDEEKIRLKSEKSIDALQRPLSFYAITDKKPDEYDIEVQPAYTFTNMTFSGVTFASNSDEFIPNIPFELYADSVKTYLSFPENKNKTILIVGHTDNKDSEKYNLGLGKRRAEAAKKWIVEHTKIPTDKIKTNSKGETEPIAPNDTDENREKNRRVNIQIK